MEPLQTIYWLWDAWVVSWGIAAVIWSARTVARPLVWSQAWRDALAFSGGIVLIGFSAPQISQGSADPDLHAILLAPLWRLPAPLAWGAALMTAAGLGFCWWARLHLGRLWSGVAARKVGQRVVDTGPYGLVRHPIYSGLLASLLAMALLKATLLGFAGLGVAVVGFWLRARLEERFLRSELGPETYDDYSRRTPMLVPFVPPSSVR